VRIDFRTIFTIWYKISDRFIFLYLLRLSMFCNAPRDMRKFPQKYQKIAGCWESAVYGYRPPINSKPDSSPPERPNLDNITSQSWFEATCPYTSSVSAYLRFQVVTIFLLEKTRQSTRSGGTGACCIRPWLQWYCQDRFVPEGISQVSRRSEVGNTKRRSLNTQLSSGTSAGIFAVSAGPYRNYHAKTGTKNEHWHVFGTISKKWLENRSSRFEPKNSWLSFSRGSVHP